MQLKGHSNKQTPELVLNLSSQVMRTCCSESNSENQSVAALQFQSQPLAEINSLLPLSPTQNPVSKTMETFSCLYNQPDPKQVLSQTLWKIFLCLVRLAKFSLTFKQAINSTLYFGDQMCWSPLSLHYIHIIWNCKLNL